MAVELAAHARHRRRINSWQVVALNNANEMAPIAIDLASVAT
jgi:hypothetical protein